MSNYPFWTESPFQINSNRLVRFLGEIGFGQYQTSEGRTTNKSLIRITDKVIQLHDVNSMKKILIDHVQTDSTLPETTKDTVLDKLVRMNPSTLGTYSISLPVWSQQGFEGSSVLKTMVDTETTCHLPFKNGVVVIEKGDSSSIGELKSYDILGDNYIWESSIIPHEITTDEGNLINRPENGLFSEFVKFALQTDLEPNIEEHKPYQYKHFDNENIDETKRKKYLDAWNAFVTGYGYLIHNYNSPDDMKMVVFVDMESSSTRAEGRNGKSLTMKTIEQYKKTTFIDGKSFRKSLNDSSRFNFSNVTVDTKLVIINDLNPDLDLTQLFSQITDDFTIEGKGTNKIVIPREKKPKMSCNTNYVISGSGASYDGRQHIVEFGNYWNKCERMRIKPKDILGKKICDHEFSDKDWDDFFKFGIYCIQRYLNEGLIVAPNTEYQRKNFVQLVEGESGTGDLVNWIEEWCNTERKTWDYHVEGISENDLYTRFRDDRPDLMMEWDPQRFHTAVYDFAVNADGYDYNPHKSSLGNTKTKRRWRKGSVGKQENYVLITHCDD